MTPLLLSITFFAFATSGVTFIKLFGLGLAVAVLVDAFIVRSMLVPALMKLAGDWNWWAPAPLRNAARPRTNPSGASQRSAEKGDQGSM